LKIVVPAAAIASTATIDDVDAFVVVVDAAAIVVAWEYPAVAVA